MQSRGQESKPLRTVRLLLGTEARRRRGGIRRQTKGERGARECPDSLEGRKSGQSEEETRGTRSRSFSMARGAQIRGLARLPGRERAVAPSSGVQKRRTFQGGVLW